MEDLSDQPDILSFGMVSFPLHRMQPHLPELLSSAIRSIPSPFPDRSAAIRFLSSRDMDKPNDLRLFAWLIVFNLIPPFPSKLASSLCSRCDSYLDIVRSFPAESDSADVRMIQLDTSRSISWFTEMAQDPAFSRVPTVNASCMADRILAAMSRDYFQGYDRYVYVTLLLSLDFCTKADLPTELAEALAFILSREFLDLTNIPALLENSAATQADFERMDEELMEYAPEWILQLRKSRLGSIHFALRWKILLFADEYPIRPLLLVWDHVLTWRGRYSDFLHALCMAHVKYTPLPRQGEAPIKVIQTYRGWDVRRVLDEAEARVGVRQPWNKWLWVIIGCVLILLLLVRYVKDKTR
jgi:hypothetical protein